MSYLVPTKEGVVQVVRDYEDVPAYLKSRGLKASRYACAHVALEPGDMCWPCERMREKVMHMLEDVTSMTCEYNPQSNARMPWWESSSWSLYGFDSTCRAIQVFLVALLEETPVVIANLEAIEYLGDGDFKIERDIAHSAMVRYAKVINDWVRKNR